MPLLPDCSIQRYFAPGDTNVFTGPISSYSYHTNTHMKIESAVRILAGTMVLLSLALAHWMSAWWLLLAAFVGVNLIQSAFTGFCPAEMAFRKLGIGNERGKC
jgi:DUF2892 family protein